MCSCPPTSSLFPYTTLFRSQEVEAHDPAFWIQWDAYRRDPDAPRAPIDVSNLLVAMAPHVSRFLQRLFVVDAHADRKSIRLNSSHLGNIVCSLLLEKKKKVS